MHIFGNLILQQLEPDIDQQTGSKLAKEFVKVTYGHLAYLTFMQSTSWEMLDWKKHKMESSLPWEISITADGSDSKASVYDVGDQGSIPGLGRSLGEGNGNPLQYSCLENPMDRGDW